MYNHHSWNFAIFFMLSNFNVTFWHLFSSSFHYGDAGQSLLTESDQCQTFLNFHFHYFFMFVKLASKYLLTSPVQYSLAHIQALHILVSACLFCFMCYFPFLFMNVTSKSFLRFPVHYNHAEVSQRHGSRHWILPVPAWHYACSVFFIELLPRPLFRFPSLLCFLPLAVATRGICAFL